MNLLVMWVGVLTIFCPFSERLSKHFGTGKDECQCWLLWTSLVPEIEKRINLRVKPTRVPCHAPALNRFDKWLALLVFCLCLGGSEMVKEIRLPWPNWTTIHFDRQATCRTKGFQPERPTNTNYYLLTHLPRTNNQTCFGKESAALERPCQDHVQLIFFF